ncbi:TPA: transcription termination factor NusG [Escherichia coli]|nr:transcription termination factor NusG [Escherichia coli]HAV9253335.1 transcription termination factor NusG [Escherichia coli]HAW0316560.1 transcription termination factor NusG [Escherichia coli]HAW1122951.1 transcription termination factor NusG [Escherichia coli]HCH7642705.1 transcription termination factor NusG [Escherichia coli]
MEEGILQLQAQWYVLEFCTVRFKSVFAFLDSLGVEWFCPMHTTLQRRSDKLRSYRKVCSPLFPGYLFVRIDFDQLHTTAVTRNQYIRRFVSFGSEPVPLDDDIIHSLRDEQNHDGELSREVKLIDHDFAAILIIDDPLKRSLALLNYLASHHLRHAS